MPIQERQQRAQRLRRLVEKDDVTVWFRDQLADIAGHASEQELRERGGTDRVA